MERDRPDREACSWEMRGVRWAKLSVNPSQDNDPAMGPLLLDTRYPFSILASVLIEGQDLEFA